MPEETNTLKCPLCNRNRHYGYCKVVVCWFCNTEVSGPVGICFSCKSKRLPNIVKNITV